MPAGYVFRIQFAADRQAGLGRGRCDQLDDHLMADKRSAAPVAGDEREQTMLDLVPLARARREVAHGDRKAEFVGEPLQFDLPQAARVSRCCRRRRR